MSKAKIGKKRGAMLQETKYKISKANRKENMSEETRVKRSDSKKKKVIAIHNITKEEIIFNSCEDAANFFNVSCPTITRWCRKLRNPSADYNFDYLSTNND